MFYIVQLGDNLWTISRKLNRSINDILNTNLICNPNIISPGLLLVIPNNNINSFKTGGSPYYVVQFGDTLECLANYFGNSVKELLEINNLNDGKQLKAGNEILVGFKKEDPQKIYETWSSVEVPCESLSSLALHGIFYIGTFRWEALGELAIPYLSKLSKHPCEIVRFYTVISLGRIATESAKEILEKSIDDISNSQYIKLAIQRINGVQRFQNKRFHITTNDHVILKQLNLNSEAIKISKGTEIIGVRWNIPSPEGEEAGPGGIQIYDLVQIVETKEIGFMPRVGYSAIWLI